eukprot:UN26474
MGQLVSILSKVKPLGVAIANANLKRVLKVKYIRPETE